MERYQCGRDYTMPVEEYERVEKELDTYFMNPENDIQIINVSKGARIRLRFRTIENPAQLSELEDILRNQIKVKGLGVAPVFGFDPRRGLM